MDRTDLSERTKMFALEVIKFYQKLPHTGAANVMGNQLLRCGTSVAANYRASRRARSDREFYSKLCIVVEETDETGLWLELIKESGISDDPSTDNPDERSAGTPLHLLIQSQNIQRSYGY